MESKNEKLAQARKKLLNYQKKQQKSRTETSSPVPSVSSLNDANSSRPASSIQSAPMFNHDEKRSPFEWLHHPAHGLNSIEIGSDRPVSSEPSEGFRNEDHSEVSTTSATVSLENGSTDYHRDDEGTSQPRVISTEEFNRVNAALAEAVQEKEKIAAQLVDLHRHYSQMYTAYNSLVATVQAGSSGDSEVQTQLAQLRTAMSVVVEEKTALQQQLREANDLAKRRLEDLQSLKDTISDKTSRAAALERELNDFKKENENFNEVIRRQKEELDRNRREAINLQASILHVQQDRSDAQERLKLSMKSAEELQAELDEARKQLRLKELYIRQLGAYSASAAVNEQDIRNLHAENERLAGELARAQAEVNQFKREAQAAREHYESYGAQLNQNVLALSSQLEETSRERMLLQDKVQSLEEEVQRYRSQQRTDSQVEHNKEEKILVNSEGNDRASEERMQEIQVLKAELEYTRQRALEAEQTSSVLSTRYQQLEAELANKVLELDDANKNLIRVQGELNDQLHASQDFRTLSGELQNEKATVSRAIAQNRELKDQLMELQDKMISMSTENMELESDRLTATHTIEQLTAEIAKLKGLAPEEQKEEVAHDDLQMSVPREFADKNEDTRELPVIEDEAIIQTAAVDQMVQERTDERVAQFTLEIEDLRAENRRVIQQNEELHRIMEQNAEDENQNNIHVELGQAIERINVLSAENGHLRQLNAHLQQTVNEQKRDLEFAASQAASSETHMNGTAEEVRTEQPVSRLQEFAPPTMLEKPLAWTELEARFAKVMRQNAELVEQNELLEHVILQLQSENDTIGEYVTIYHHQRKLIKERMRDRDEAVAKLSLEKEQIKQKLNDLQSAVSSLFSSKDSLKKLAQRMGQGEMAEKAPSKRNKQLRSFSHSTVDEFSGDEETIVDGTNQIIPETNGVLDGKEVLENDAVSDQPVMENGPGPLPPEENVEVPGEILEEKIIRLINELQDIEQARIHPPCAVNVCCRECRGKLITL